MSTRLGWRDRLGRWSVRWSLGRGRYRVEPGLYRAGEPDADSPVLVSANYKLSFDELRSRLPRIDAWILVLDTDGVNVWCAAGKGTFGTEELVGRIEETGLAELVRHRRLIVPQLGATGVAAHEVRRRSGFRVVWGPVRARELPAFFAAGLRADGAMRRVSFTLGERAELIGVELVAGLRYLLPLLLVLLLWPGGGSLLSRMARTGSWGTALLTGVLAGTVVVPLLLPWIPGRAFSLKGALAGGALVALALWLLPSPPGLMARTALWLIGTALASFTALQFTGATPFTSPSGVEREMRRSLGWQLGAAVLGLGMGAWGLLS